MLTNLENQTTIIDSNVILPFQVSILIGTKGKEEKISLNQLVLSSKEAHRCVYTIQELKRFIFDIRGDFTGKVKFLWNNLYHFQQEDIADTIYTLSNKNPNILIYEHGKTENAYPWRCGYYQFCIIYDEQHFYGMIKIEPKNLSYDQLEWIQESLNQQINGIMNDPLYFKKSTSKFTQNGSVYFWPIIRFLELHQTQLITALQLFKVKHKQKIDKSYVLSKKQKRIDFKTIQWSIMNESIKNSKNIVIQPQLTISNYENELVYMKQKIYQFLLTLKTYISFVQYEFQKEAEKLKQFENQINDLDRIISNVSKNGCITEREKAKYRQTKALKQIELENLSVGLNEKRRIIDSLNKIHDSYYREYFEGIFSKIKDKSSCTFPTNTTKSFSYLVHLITLFEKKIKEYGKKVMLIPVYKPTFLLYEYFIYFSLCQLLKKLQFKTEEESLAEQVLQFIKDDELMDGAKVEFVNKHFKLRLIYNEIIEGSPQVALLKGSHFFSGDESKKPDVRLDLYKRKTGEFCCAILFEVKYSPMFNIYQPVGNTKAMEQMYKYWGLKYVERIDGKLRYHRKPIQEVICLYPGSSIHRKIIEAGCGTYIQYFPKKNNQQLYEIIGEKEILTILGNVLQKYM